MKDTVGVLGAAKKQLFGKTQNPALAVSRKMKDTIGVLGANKLFTYASSCNMTTTVSKTTLQGVHYAHFHHRL